MKCGGDCRAVLEEIRRKGSTRKTVAAVYSESIPHFVLSSTGCCREANVAIMARWSASAVEYIKRIAWRPYEDTK